MSDQQTGASLTLPMAVARQFFHFDYMEVISEVCVPLHQASDGDIVALSLDSDLTSTGFNAGQVRDVVLCTPDEFSGFTQVAFSELSEKVQRQIAYPCMALQCNKIIYDDVIQSMISQMPSYSGRQSSMELMLLPHAAFISETALYMKLFTAQDRSNLQHMIDESLLALLRDRPETSHEILEMKPQLDLLLKFANSFWAASGPKFGGPQTPLALPRLDGLMGTKIARTPQ